MHLLACECKIFVSWVMIYWWIVVISGGSAGVKTYIHLGSSECIFYSFSIVNSLNFANRNDGGSIFGAVNFSKKKLKEESK